MSHGPASSPSVDLKERLRPEPRLKMLPSWFLSVLLHAALLILLASGVWNRGVPAQQEGDFREVGIRLKEPPGTPESPRPDEAHDSAIAAAFAPHAVDSVQPPEVAEPAPAPLALPSQDRPALIGPAGPAPSGGPPRDASALLPGGTVGRQAGGAAYGDVRFLGADDKGQRIVYVVDASGSMSFHNAMLVARSELIASIESLEATQQFQVIFYNNAPMPMLLGRDRSTRLYYATDINRTLARQYIQGVHPNLGTNHMPALRQALRLEPDVLFFLTDAGEPALRRREMDEIKKLHGGATRIHCIEFGVGSELTSQRAGNFLVQLARENGGTYRYRDVTAFTR